MARTHERRGRVAWWGLLALLVFPGVVHALDAGDTRAGMAWKKLGHENVVESAFAYLGSPYASPDERRAYRWLGEELGCNHICGKPVSALCDTTNNNCAFYNTTRYSIAACVPQQCDWKTQGIDFAKNYTQYYAAVTDYLYDWWICDDPDDCVTVTDVPFDDIDGFWTRQHHFLDLKWNPTYDGTYWTGNGKGSNGYGGYSWRRSFHPEWGHGSDGDDWAYLLKDNDFWGHVSFSGPATGFPNVSTVGSAWYNGCASPIHGQYRSLPSPCAQSEYSDYSETTNYPVTDLVRFWFNRFHDGLGGTTPAGSKALFQYVAMSLHGLGDMSVAQHTLSTMGNNHGEFEVWVDDHYSSVWGMALNVGGKPLNNFEDACVARVNQGSYLSTSGFRGTWTDAMGDTRGDTFPMSSSGVSPFSTVQSIVTKAGHHAYGGNYKNMLVSPGDINPAAVEDASRTLPASVAATALMLTKAVNRWYGFYNFQQTPNLTTNSMGSTPACEGHFDLYVVEDEGYLAQKYGFGGEHLGQGTGGFTPGWGNLGGVLLGKPGVVWRTVDNTDVYGIGTNRHVVQRWWSASTGWSGWGDMGAPPGVIFPYGPDANSMREDHVEFFAVGNDGNLWHRWWFQASGWSGWYSEGYPLAGTLHVPLRSAPTSVSWGDGRVDVFAKANDGNIWQRSSNGPYGWGPWVNIGGGGSMPLDPVNSVTTFSGPELLDATSWGSQRIDLFVLGSDRAIWQRTWDGRWSDWRSLGGVCWSNPTAVARSDRRLTVFCRGSDRGLYWKFFQGTADGGFYPHPNSKDGWSDWAKFSNDSGDSYYGIDAATRSKPRPGKNDTVSSQHLIPLGKGSGSFEFWGTTAGYVNDSTASCAGTAASPDATYGLHLDSRSRVVLSLAGSLYDTALVVRNRTTGAELGCNDDANGTLQSELTLTLEPGDYTLYVDGYSTTNSGAYKLTASVTPLNDTVATAYKTPRNGGSFQGTTSGLANDYLGCGGNLAPDAVHEVVLDRPARLVLDTAGSSFRTMLGLMRADGVVIACPASYAGDGVSRMDLNLAAGTYYVQVDGEGSAQGAYQLNVNIR